MREWEKYEKPKELKQEAKLSGDAGVREGVKAAGGLWSHWKQVWQLVRLWEEARVNIIYFGQLLSTVPVTASSLTSLTWIATFASLLLLLKRSGDGWCSCLSVLHLGTLSSTLEIFFSLLLNEQKSTMFCCPSLQPGDCNVVLFTPLQNMICSSSEYSRTKVA